MGHRDAIAGYDKKQKRVLMLAIRWDRPDIVKSILHRMSEQIDGARRISPELLEVVVQRWVSDLQCALQLALELSCVSIVQLLVEQSKLHEHLPSLEEVHVDNDEGTAATPAAKTKLPDGVRTVSSSAAPGGGRRDAAPSSYHRIFAGLDLFQLHWCAEGTPFHRNSQAFQQLKAQLKAQPISYGVSGHWTSQRRTSSSEEPSGENVDSQAEARAEVLRAQLRRMAPVYHSFSPLLAMHATSSSHVQPSHVVFWALMAGQYALAEALWPLCDAEPLFVTLMAARICTHAATKVVRPSVKAELARQGELFEARAVGVLEAVHTRAAAHLLLWRVVAQLPIKNLELAAQLQMKSFISHPYCRSLADLIWRGGTPDATSSHVTLHEGLSYSLLLLHVLLPVQLRLVASVHAGAQPPCSHVRLTLRHTITHLV